MVFFKLIKFSNSNTHILAHICDKPQIFSTGNKLLIEKKKQFKHTKFECEKILNHTLLTLKQDAVSISVQAIFH